MQGDLNTKVFCSTAPFYLCGDALRKNVIKNYNKRLNLQKRDMPTIPCTSLYDGHHGPVFPSKHAMMVGGCHV